jgi:uncharacterized protein (TIGR02996 family)
LPTPSDGDALIAAMRAGDWSELTRLAYADWLEENGEREWAEFIRSQVASHRGDVLPSLKLWDSSRSSQWPHSFLI